MEDKQDEKIKEKTNETKTINKYKSLGNFLLTLMVVIIVGTGALIYYLMYTARTEYENQISADDEINQEEYEPETIANLINTVVSNDVNSSATIDSSNVSSRKVLNENLIVLYNGLILDTSGTGQIELKYIDYSSSDKDKYVITYYNYENYGFQESKLGTLSSQIYDGLIKIDNVRKVAISENYNAIPREIKVINSIPSILLDKNVKLKDYDMTKTIISDLDGNSTEEYIVVVANKSTGFSKIALFDSRGDKVSDLASIEKNKWSPVTNQEYYLSISNVEIVDVDNDGVMEILVEIPKYEGDPSISLLEYKNGELSGKTNIECSLLP